MSGSMFWNNTPLALEFARRWKRREKGQYMIGQVVLGETWHFNRPDGLRTVRLPETYCKIAKFEYKQDEGPDQIRHASASVQGGRAAAGIFTREQKQQERNRRHGIMI